MSGGSWNYAYTHVRNFADDLIGGETHPLRMQLVSHMRDLADVMKAIEWSDSLDTMRDAWIAPTAAFLAKRPDIRANEKANEKLE